MAEDKDATVTTQPSVTTKEAEETDEVLSPVGDEKTKVPSTPKEPEANDADVATSDG